MLRWQSSDKSTLSAKIANSPFNSLSSKLLGIIDAIPIDSLHYKQIKTASRVLQMANCSWLPGFVTLNLLLSWVLAARAYAADQIFCPVSEPVGLTIAPAGLLLC